MIKVAWKWGGWSRCQTQQVQKMDPDPLGICQDGIDDPGPNMVVNITSGTDPYDIIVWNPARRIFGTTGTLNYPGDMYDFDEKTPLLPVFLQTCVYTSWLYGCRSWYLWWGWLSMVHLSIIYPAPLVCGQNSTVLTADFDFETVLLPWSIWYVWLRWKSYCYQKSDPSTFNISDLSANNCFVFAYIYNNGCLDIKNISSRSTHRSASCIVEQ